MCVYSRKHYLTLLLACVQYVPLALVYWLYCLLDCTSCITFLIDSTICYVMCNVLLTGLYCLLLLVLCIIPKCTVYLWCMLGHTLLFEGARCTICMLGKYINWYASLLGFGSTCHLHGLVHGMRCGYTVTVYT